MCKHRHRRSTKLQRKTHKPSHQQAYHPTNTRHTSTDQTRHTPKTHTNKPKPGQQHDK